MRIASHASEQYRRNTVPAEKPREKASVQAQAKTTTTSFGFTLGKFGLRYESQSTRLDPSLSRDVREKRRQAQSFNAEREVETLRAKVGAEGAAYRETTGASTAAPEPRKPALHQIKNALSAYGRNAEDLLPPPGNMLASVV